MENENRRSAHPLLYVITTLLALNLVLTLWLATEYLQRSDSQSVTTQKLPDALAKPERERLFNDFRTYFNAENFEALFEMFDKVARVHMSQENFNTTLKALRKGMGAIKDGAYTHYEFVGTREGRKWFKLFYNLRMGNGDPHFGTLSIDVFYDGERYGMTSFNLRG